METIKNYLDSMFAKLPGTYEVLRAKDELLSMMEDKYNELIREGKNENEAVGTVISEFGNLDELSEVLGIQDVINPSVNSEKITIEQVKKYISTCKLTGVLIGIGVLLCIISPVVVIIVDGINSAEILEMLGIGALLLFIAVAVALFIIAGSMKTKWKSLFDSGVVLDNESAIYVATEQEKYRTIFLIKIVIGVFLCIISVIPCIFAEVVSQRLVLVNGQFIENIGVVALLVIVAVAVYLFVSAGVSSGAYTDLLKPHSAGNTINVMKNDNVEYINDTAKFVMDVYWETVTCIYLSWSFLTFHWHVSWIIWPLAAVVHALLKNILRK